MRTYIRMNIQFHILGFASEIFKLALLEPVLQPKEEKEARDISQSWSIPSKIMIWKTSFYLFIVVEGWICLTLALIQPHFTVLKFRSVVSMCANLTDLINQVPESATLLSDLMFVTWELLICTFNADPRPYKCDSRDRPTLNLFVARTEPTDQICEPKLWTTALNLTEVFSTQNKSRYLFYLLAIRGLI